MPQCLNCRGVGRVEPPPSYFLDPPNGVPYFVLGGGSVHTAHVRFTSQFGKTLTAGKNPTSYFSTIQTLACPNIHRWQNALKDRDSDSVEDWNCCRRKEILSLPSTIVIHERTNGIRTTHTRPHTKQHIVAQLGVVGACSR